MNFEKNPFSLYDFLGYLIPGAFALFVISYFLYAYNHFGQANIDINKFCSLSGFCEMIKGDYDLWKMFFPFVIVSYSLGHLISYLSSQTIEKILVRSYGYPSEYLICRDEYKTKRYFPQNECFISLKFLYLFIVFVLFWPITFIVVLCKNCIFISEYITKPLDDEIIDVIKKKVSALKVKLEIDNVIPPNNKNTKTIDFHRIIMHYVYCNVPNSQVKTDNYVALYGFLRSLSFLFSIILDAIIAIRLGGYFNGFFDNKRILLIMFLAFSAFVSFMAYCKFYRRYTLENYMLLIVAPSLEDEVPLQSQKDTLSEKPDKIIKEKSSIKKIFISLNI